MSITKIEALKGTEVNLKINELFGVVHGKVMALGTDSAKITFTSFGSAYVMVVPTSWIYTKSTDGKTVDLKAGAQVTANIESADVWSRKVTLLDLNSVGILIEVGNRTRFIVWDRVKQLDVPREDVPGKTKSNFGRAPKADVAPKAAKVPTPKVVAKVPAAKVPARPVRR
jgi:hypothetical protein